MGPDTFICCFVCTGTVRVWHANTYRLETTLNYGLERVWAIANMKGSNSIALGYDEGSIIIKVRPFCLLTQIFLTTLFCSGRLIRHEQIKSMSIGF